MITGIYNLPKEVCDYVGKAIDDYISHYDETIPSEAYSYDVKNIFSILSVDNKIMLCEFEPSNSLLAGKYSIILARVLADNAVVLTNMMTMPGGSLLVLSFGVFKEEPDKLMLNISITN